MTAHPAASQNNQSPGVRSRKRKLNSQDDNSGEDSLSQLEASKIEFASGLIIKYLRHLNNDNLPGRSDMQAQDCCHRDRMAPLQYFEPPIYLAKITNAPRLGPHGIMS
ncbi:hypothetical protein ARMGADRAFT_670947 [Armillaria gallica]|uniref:Uncharacterized protein n=1 Tax=Armillaria gallica TaxID=47427 RepID=A0A2H3D371_ARMGA|nr:hypothetical protein ARMGADRAFT_670947 [Armillaria gallica]